MSTPSRLHIFFATLLILLPFISGCRSDEPEFGSDINVGGKAVTVYETESTEWHVCLVATGMFYVDAVAVSVPAPFYIPSKEEAQVLRTCTFPSSERFVTSDGFTFGCPSASVTKAGAKTKYSVLGLYIRPTTIDVPF